MHCRVYVLIVFCLEWQMSNFKFCQHFEKLIFGKLNFENWILKIKFWKNNFEMKEAIYCMSWVNWRKQHIVWVELIEGSRNILTGSIIIIFLTGTLMSSLANIIWLKHRQFSWKKNCAMYCIKWFTFVVKKSYTSQWSDF